MTREEAIEKIENLDNCYNQLSDDDKEALDMAIEALKVNEVHIIITHDIDGSPYVERCFDNLKSAIEYADYLHSQNIEWDDLLSKDLYSSI